MKDLTKYKEEDWKGNKIRFVLVDEEEWYAVGNDVASALGYSRVGDALSSHVAKKDMRSLSYKAFGETPKVNLLWQGNDFSDKTVISEYGIYSLMFSSKLKEAEVFRRWVFSVIKELRKSTGSEIFEMLSVETQKKAMEKLKDGLLPKDNISYIKANTITNKAIANMFELSKSISKDSMSEEMKQQRIGILDDTVQLMITKQRFGFPIKVSTEIYKKYSKGNANDKEN